MNPEISPVGEKGIGIVKAIFLTFLLILGVWVIFAEGRKAYLDHEVRELCAKDGGIKVYEAVKLPVEKYNKLLDKFGRLLIPFKDQAKTTDEYYTDSATYYYRKGNPEMSREQYRIVRRSDGKVLGELVFYGRGGGDFPSPSHDSSYTCPAPTNLPNFESSIFVKGE